MPRILWTAFVVGLLFVACQGEGDSLYDFDGDGSLDELDCRPSDPEIYPGAVDTWGNGTDEDCDGVDGNAVDQDGDGYAAHVDCDDRNSAVHPQADDVAGDGVDSDCDKVDGVATDLDGDGFHTGFDCDDSNPDIHPGADDPVGDDTDQNCDQVEGLAIDADGDGRHSGIDCDDDDPTVHPGAWDQPLDGIDSDCDGLDGAVVDADQDGFSELTDCNDDDASIYPGAPEVDADGIDSDCDGLGAADCTELVSLDFEGGDGSPHLQFVSGPDATWSEAWGLQSHSSERALYYGSIPAGNFDFGVNSGDAWTILTVPDSDQGTHALTFWVYLDVDDGMATDQLGVSVVDGDGDLATWNKLSYDFTNPATWQQQGLWLGDAGVDYDPESDGHQLKLFLSFDSVDDSENQGEGVFLDDILLSVCAS